MWARPVLDGPNPTLYRAESFARSPGPRRSLPRPQGAPKGHQIAGALRSLLRGLHAAASPRASAIFPAFPGRLERHRCQRGRARGETASPAHLELSARSMDATPDPPRDWESSLHSSHRRSASGTPIGCFRRCAPPLPGGAENTSRLSFSPIGSVKGRVRDVKKPGSIRAHQTAFSRTPRSRVRREVAALSRGL